MINKDDIYFLNTNKSVRIKNLIFLNIKKVNLSSGGFGTEATFEVNEEDRLSWSQLMPEFQKNGSIDDLITEHLDRMKSDDESIMIFITSIKPSKRKKTNSTMLCPLSFACGAGHFSSFLTSGSDSTDRNPPWGHLQMSGNL